MANTQSFFWSSLETRTTQAITPSLTPILHNLQRISTAFAPPAGLLLVSDTQLPTLRPTALGM